MQLQVSIGLPLALSQRKSSLTTTSAGKSLVDRAKGKEPMVNQVGALVFPNDRAARIECLLRIYDRRENLIVDFDQLEGVLGDVTARSRDRGDGIADEPDFIMREAMAR